MADAVLALANPVFKAKLMILILYYFNQGGIRHVLYL